MDNTEQNNQVTRKKSPLPFIIIGVASLAVVAAIVLVIAFSRGGTASKKYSRQMEIAGKYMSDMDYENAVLAYNEAISIDPSRADAYLGLADAYLALGDPKKAIEVLQMGLDNVSDEDGRERIQQKIKEVEADTGEAPSSSEPVGEEVDRQALLDCYTAYLEFIQANTKMQDPELEKIGENYVVAFCDVVGDELPDIIYKEYRIDYDVGYVDLNIATYNDDTKVRSGVQFGGFNTQNMETQQYYLFQREGDKRVYLIQNFSGNSCCVYVGDSDNEMIAREDVYPDYTQKEGEYYLYNQPSSADEVEAKIREIKADASQIIIHSKIKGAPEAHSSIWSDDESSFIQSKPCIEMTYDEAVAYLQEQIAELSK